MIGLVFQLVSGLVVLVVKLATLLGSVLVPILIAIVRLIWRGLRNADWSFVRRGRRGGVKGQSSRDSSAFYDFRQRRDGLSAEQKRPLSQPASRRPARLIEGPPRPLRPRPQPWPGSPAT